MSSERFKMHNDYKNVCKRFKNSQILFGDTPLIDDHFTLYRKRVEKLTKENIDLKIFEYNMQQYKYGYYKNCSFITEHIDPLFKKEGCTKKEELIEKYE